MAKRDPFAEHWDATFDPSQPGHKPVSQPDSADDLGLDREARWQPDGAELVERLEYAAEIWPVSYPNVRRLLREAAGALTAAQQELEKLREEPPC